MDMIKWDWSIAGQRDVEIAGATFKAPEYRHPEAPAEKPYRFNEKQTRDLSIGLRCGLNVILTGPPGCGKTSLPIALAARLGRPCVRFNLDGETRRSHLIGISRPATDENGALTLRFDEGKFVQALREGWWIVLDELDIAPPNVTAALHSVLEDVRVLTIPETGETVHAHPEAAIFATGNTFGYVPTLSQDYIDGICRVADDLRKDEKFRADFSTRRLIQWARLIEHYPIEHGQFDVLYPMELAVVRKLESATDQKVARELAARIFGYTDDEIKKYLGEIAQKSA
jgi:midasin (ATPase involved in ribosome maturation)